MTTWAREDPSRLPAKLAQSLMRLRLRDLCLSMAWNDDRSRDPGCRARALLKWDLTAKRRVRPVNRVFTARAEVLNERTTIATNLTRELHMSKRLPNTQRRCLHQRGLKSSAAVQEEVEEKMRQSPPGWRPGFYTYVPCALEGTISIVNAHFP